MTEPITPSVYADEGGVTIWHGDCIDTIALLEDSSIDAVVTDPPYGIGFMGHEWDQPGVAIPEGRREGRPPGQKRRTNPDPGGSRREGPAMYAGLYDLSRGANRAFQGWCERWAAECYRVLKPGGYLVAFGAPRTDHRLANGIEDAGFEIRDKIMWAFGQGFPKSWNVTEAMDDFIENGPTVPTRVYEVTAFLRAARDGAGWTNRRIDALFGTNGMAGHWTTSGSQPAVPSPRQWDVLREALGFDHSLDALVEELGSTERPEDWGSKQLDFLEALKNSEEYESVAGGWGSALKPGYEPIVVGRKPYPNSLAANIRRWGTGGINIGGTRVGTSGGTRSVKGAPGNGLNRVYGNNMGGAPNEEDFVAGRWPTNLVLSHAPACGPDDSTPCVPGCPVLELDQQSGVSTSRRGRRNAPKAAGILGAYNGGEADRFGHADEGGASRFFPVFRYTPKADGGERVNADGVMHPTVKPLDLMRWLVRLVTPPGGTVLEPFAGSGTTPEACILEGFRCVAVERDEKYLPLIRARFDRQPSVVAERMERGEHVAPAGLLW